MKKVLILTLTLLIFSSFLLPYTISAEKIDSEIVLKDASQKALDYVLQNKTTDGIDLIPEIKIMKDKINSGNISEEILTNASAIKMQDNYSEIIKQVVIDDLLSNIIIYDDGSFIIVSGETSAKVLNSESEVYPISITSNKIWEQTYYGLGESRFFVAL